MPIEKLRCDEDFYGCNHDLISIKDSRHPRASIHNDYFLYKKINELIETVNALDKHFQGVFKIMNQQLFEFERQLEEIKKCQ